MALPTDRQDGEVIENEDINSIAAEVNRVANEVLQRAPASHTHSATDLKTGTVPVTRLGAAGSRNSSTVLHGDNTWKPVPSGGGEGGTTDHAALTNRDAADQHPIGAVTGLQSALNGKAATGHGHTINDVQYLQIALDSRAEAVHQHPVSDLTATGTPSAATYLRGDGVWATPSGGGGEGGTTDHALLTNRDAADQHPIGAVTGLQSALDSKANTTHQHTAAQISDATTTGRAVMQASSATAARTAIGAGTSNLALGTGSTTAAAGDHGHTLNAVTDTATRLAMTPAERTKLGGVATGATANATDAQLRARDSHTGTQAINTVTGLQSALDSKASTTHDHDARYVRTVNGTGPDETGNVVVEGGGGGGAAPVVDSPVPSVNYWIGMAYPTAAFGTLGGYNGAYGLSCVYLSAPMTANALAFEVATAEAGATARLVVYSSNSNGLPATLVTSSPVIDCSTSGLKEVTLFAPVALPAGLYWGTVLSTGSAVRFRAGAQFLPLIGGASLAVSQDGLAQLSITPSGTVASPAPTVSVNYNGTGGQALSHRWAFRRLA